MVYSPCSVPAFTRGIMHLWTTASRSSMLLAPTSWFSYSRSRQFSHIIWYYITKKVSNIIFLYFRPHITWLCDTFTICTNNIDIIDALLTRCQIHFSTTRLGRVNCKNMLGTLKKTHKVLHVRLDPSCSQATCMRMQPCMTFPNYAVGWGSGNSGFQRPTGYVIYRK